MGIKALKFSGDSPEFEPTQSTPEDESPEEFEKTKARRMPTAYLVPSDALEKFRKFTDLIIDRNKKNKKKGLGEYLLGKEKGRVPIIDGNYGASGQAIRSIRDFLARASKMKGQTFYIIGIKDELFGDLWEKTGVEGTKRKGRTRKKGPLQNASIPSHADQSSWLLQQLRLQCSESDERELAKKYVGESDEAAYVRALILLASKSDTPVLIVGDTGTGKDIVSRQIHENSDRKGKKFIAVNCGGIPRDLLGHMEGAFTSAGKSKMGFGNLQATGPSFWMKSEISTPNIR